MATAAPKEIAITMWESIPVVVRDIDPGPTNSQLGEELHALYIRDSDSAIEDRVAIIEGMFQVIFYMQIAFSDSDNDEIVDAFPHAKIMMAMAHSLAFMLMASGMIAGVTAEEAKKHFGRAR